ncbi:MAG: 4-hydroxy-tetrahydrodipicolinate reductase [Lachnospiraceae bacterium]|nr:4-hydroxy-tetrahydrodipicolinate reductase [Lachnospiraceae bacterium]
MVKIILHGASGFMGKVVTETADMDPNVEITAGIDAVDRKDRPYPLYMNPADCDAEADVIIDFSTAKALDGLIDYCLGRRLPLVLCTTGLSEEQLARVGEASKQIAILRSANMSLGVNLLLKLLKTAAGVLVPNGYDAEIVEMHHNRKLDAPSGTALALADAVNEGAGGGRQYTYDRQSRTQKRDPMEIGISSVRGGTIVGVHDVLFAGQDEVIEFTHTAYSRAIFAKGAIEAAKFLAGKGPGLYDMSDVIG